MVPTLPRVMNPDDLAALLHQVPADGSTIGNGAVRETLGWDEARYTAAKDALVANGTLLKGQGRGGTVRLAAGSTTPAPAPVATPTAQTQAAKPAAGPVANPTITPAPCPATKPTDQSLSAFIWSVADLLRGPYKPHEYATVILPFTVLRRLDCVLEPTKEAVLAELAKRTAAGLNPEPFLLKVSGQLFFNTSPLDLKRLMGDQDHIGENLRSYIQAFSPAVRDIFESFEIHTQIDRLAKANLLYLVTEKFATIDLHPEVVSNAQMGAVFEELIRKFAELSNETAGEHFTPREVIRLMVNLLFIEDDAALTKPGVVRSLYDPTAGTGGMLSVAGEHLASHNPNARLVMYGQELNPESYAICKADMLNAVRLRNNHRNPLDMLRG